MRRADFRPMLALAVLGLSCARGRLAEESDAALSGMTDLGPTDIVGTNWDDYPDKSHLLDAAFDAPTEPRRDVATARDLGPLDASSTSAGCGRPGEPCCGGTRCGTGAACRGEVCAEAPTCGGAGQPCCGTSACGPGNVCAGGRCAAMAACGTSGGSCCGGASPCLASLRCVSGTCAPCGSAGQSCCEGAAACYRGLSCGAGLCRAAP